MKTYTVGDKALVRQWGEDPEERAMEQIGNVATLPFVTPHLAIMPDCHAGYGATIGSVIPTENVIIPMAVGMDIGCGMLAVKTNIEMCINHDGVRAAIEKAVPHGRTSGNSEEDVGSWQRTNLPDAVANEWDHELEGDYQVIVNLDPELRKSNSLYHLGTLGTGNHFIELSVDENGETWIVIHSGSRGIGGKIANHFTALAKKRCKEWHVPLIDPSLAYFPKCSDEFHRYIKAAYWAQRFAKANRWLMMDMVRKAIERTYGMEIKLDASTWYECHHNFVAQEQHFGKQLYITRKGACRAKTTDKLVIPGSMGANSYLCTGKGERISFESCSHGAGRVMSRTEAKKVITLEEHERATRGVSCRKDATILDESPSAYKNIEDVMRAQDDLVQIDHTIKQVLCVKG